MPSNTRILGAELVGTAVLILGGPGSAILATGGPEGAGPSIGILGVSLAFGLSLLVMAYAIGPVSGCHINPAVTVGMALAKKIKPAVVPFYIVGQLVGAAVGSVLIYIIANGYDGFDAENNFAANGWGDKIGSPYGLGAAIVVEVVFTALLVFVVLRTTAKEFNPAAVGIQVGLTLTLIHLITIPVDNTSVNPARSFASAIFSGSDAWTQIWAFIVFPLVGAVVGVLIWLLVSEESLEDTMMDDERLRKARDRASGVVEKGTSRLERGEDEAATPTTPSSTP